MYLDKNNSFTNSLGLAYDIYSSVIQTNITVTAADAGFNKFVIVKQIIFDFSTFKGRPRYFLCYL